MNDIKEKYGLFTSMAMIVGIVIGSGIFFKSDNVLVGTNGNVLLGIAAFVIAALSIIFGGLSLSELAARTDKAGGAITYIEVFSGKTLGTGFGWFQTFVYYPGLIVVVSYVVGIYGQILFNLQGGFLQQLCIGFAFYTICFIFNTLSAKLGGYFQNVTMVIKLIPLFIIAFCGLLFGDPAAGFANISPASFQNASLFAAIGPVIFSYDGWIISTSIAHEVKNSRRNLPLALIIAPIFVTITYVLYFVGITSYLGADQIISMGDSHVYTVATAFLGSWGAKLILIFVIISVMGTVNGLVLGYIRIPYSMALRNWLPGSKALASIHATLNMPVVSAVLGYFICFLWYIVHYFTSTYNLLPNSDISEISIAVGYMFYILMYYQVFRLWRQGEIKSWLRGVLFPLFATIGSVFILYSCMQSPLFIYYALFCILVALVGMLYSKIKTKQV
jgi:APA family basic amino acid/polyamine antiporter